MNAHVKIFAAIFFAFPALLATGSTITYQGKLVHEDEPVDGFADLVFRLYDASDGGTQVGKAFMAEETDVTNGVFTVQLNFGDGVFDGGDRWLEVEVNGTILTPRQPLTPAPMAHYAFKAQSSEFAENAGGVEGAAIFQQDGDAAVYLGPVRIGEWDYPQSVQIEGKFASGKESVANAPSSFVAGGDGNITEGIDSFIGGGTLNRTGGNASAIAGGSSNITVGSRSFIGGGFNNWTQEKYSFIGGGVLNDTSGENSFVGGGYSNAANGFNSFIGGGRSNIAEGEESFVGAGASNSAIGQQSFVGGGTLNSASGQRSFVGGGRRNTAAGTFSFAAGTRAQALHDGTFVWADNSNTNFFSSTGENQFLIRATGGVGIGTAPLRDLHVKQGNSDTVLPGIQIERDSTNAWAIYVNENGSLILERNNETVAGFDETGAYFQLSDGNAKDSIQPLEQVLDKLAQLQPSIYNFTSAERQSIGFIAQDVQAIFPEIVSENEGAYTLNYSAISALNTAALIELSRENQALKKENRVLAVRHQGLEERIDTIERRLNQSRSR